MSPKNHIYTVMTLLLQYTYKTQIKLH